MGDHVTHQRAGRERGGVIKQITVDTSRATRDLRQLGAGVAAGALRVAMDEAETTAAGIDSACPVRTGRLAATIGTTREQYGAGVTYGGGVPYAGYIERRSHPVRKGCRGARGRFYRRLSDVADTEARRI